MVKMNFFFTIFIILFNSSIANELKSDKINLKLSNHGNIDSITFTQSGNSFSFQSNPFPGPAWYLALEKDTINLPSSFDGISTTNGDYDFLSYSIQYQLNEDRLQIKAKIKNNGDFPFQPVKLGIRLGIDTYMSHYPEWEEKVFPTLSRCEKTHFWGYFMSPKGKKLFITSSYPIASWSHDYSRSWGRPPYRFNGHRITSVNLDIINSPPLPGRHPQNSYELLPGEERIIIFNLFEEKDFQSGLTQISQLSQCPVIHLKKTTITKKEPFAFTVISFGPITVKVFSPDNTLIKNHIKQLSDNSYQVTIPQCSLYGQYKIKVKTKDKISQGRFYVRKQYDWYVEKAAEAVFKYHQKASASHCESWYGLYTGFSAAKILNDSIYASKTDSVFSKIYPKVFDTSLYEPLAIKHRIQNVSTIIGVLTDRYELFEEIEDLEKALRFADYLINRQSEDGAFRAGETHYTSVIYIAKSLMELLYALKPFKESKAFKKPYQKIFNSVQKAMDELAKNKTNIQTEGEMTFEDGMISCSALQLSLFALLLKEEGLNNEKYKKAAIDIFKQHECLEQLIVPDCRMNSASLRFWEAQYDVLMDNNFLNSPHGWSAWTSYANYYIYLLTGNSEYLYRLFNGINAGIQMIDLKTGDLRWAFMVNPYVKIKQIAKNIPGATPFRFSGIHYHADEFKNNEYIMGEEYVDMVSHWFFANSNDNDVHEHFKCLMETVYDKAFIHEDGKGDIVCFNCVYYESNDSSSIDLRNSNANKIHINIKRSRKINFINKEASKTLTVSKGNYWITPFDNN